MDPLCIWSWRKTVALGWTWQRERACTKDTASDWLNVYQSDEPNVTFRLSRTKPKSRGWPMDPQNDLTYTMCPYCDSPGALIGQHGNLESLRCENCGEAFALPILKVS